MLQKSVHCSFFASGIIAVFPTNYCQFVSYMRVIFNDDSFKITYPMIPLTPTKYKDKISIIVSLLTVNKIH